MSTINGKKLIDVLSGICEPAAPTKMLQGRYPYYSIDAYEQRLIGVLGREHFIPVYGDIKEIQLSTGQVVLTASCTIEFIDDDGVTCYRAHGLGTHEITYSSNNGMYIGLDNEGYLVQQQAFKSACKSMQIFGIHEIEDFDESKPKASSNQDKESKPIAKVMEETFYTTGAFSQIGTDSHSDKPIYKVYGHKQVITDGGAVLETVESGIVFYPNQYTKCVEMLNNCIARCNDGAQHMIKIKVSASNYNKDKGPQYVFKGFWR